MKAANDQLEKLAMVYGGLGTTEIRARMAKLCSELIPGMTGFLFPCGGAEANEAAIRIARRFTGRPKIMTRYRSYHGGTAAALTATGDFRRGFAEAGQAGFVKFMDPNPFQFKWGESEADITSMSLRALDEQVIMEGPSTIAAIMLETFPGSNGVVVPPKGYIEGVRALCDKSGILFISDEVMTGWGRTGKWFGYQHFDGVQPDIVTSAKGLTGAMLPLSVVGMSREIQDFFKHTPLGWGATYQGHPVCLALAYEVINTPSTPSSSTT